MASYTRVKAKRKINQAVANLEVGRRHLEDFRALGYCKLETIDDAVMSAELGIDEVQKLLKRTVERI